MYEYMARKHLAKIGVLVSGEISAFKAECFVIIADELATQEIKQLKRQKGGR